MQPSLARLEGWTIACEPSLHAAETSLLAAFRVKVPIQFSNSSAVIASQRVGAKRRPMTGSAKIPWGVDSDQV
jgi:hypothetical protein